MPPVFAHGRLRLYLLKLLDEAPRHGYEIIRLLEERFQGLYAPSAGTVYPRLAKLEAEGLVTHTTEGGRKVYAITDAGRAELGDRAGELAGLEREIQESVTALAADIQEDVRGAAGALRRELREAAGRLRDGSPGAGGQGGDAFAGMKEELRRAKEEWKEQARRAKEESRRARQEAQQARHQAREAHEHTREEVLRIKERVQEQVREHARRGDWPTGLMEGVSALAQELGALAGGRPESAPGSPTVRVERADAPEWASVDYAHSTDPARDLDRLLDRFRDEIRDAARDHGVTAGQLDECREHLAEAAMRMGGVLRR
ncbi:MULTISPECIES: PadR family transcriptional regulator [Streptomyces]|uniref:PadR family transcriptional regulator n=1 Tax=Streptomyces TaxID=1883 RepID=UPI00163CB463|nr:MULTISPECIES: PadR family transcriptional regulator [Streptomyces]MBC2873541.1 helix-turn-helix transcriptional regulator [Streptomyces sp. TYQ1024]UBI36842.1 helix-turn-helix transcriptional regulator [Streptomyces mobaraensis]UKW29434.1 helix-turn-helix transcriptional regulator [Streptomyces sp. TYQ1024]